MAQSAASDHAGFAARIVGVADKLRPNRKQIDAEAAIEEMLRHYPDGDAELVRRAYAYAAEAHRDQRRVSGGPYIEHPAAVALLIAQLGMDPATVAASMLHDVPEDTSRTTDDIRREFGDEIARLVEGVTKLSQFSGKTSDEHQAENIRKMFLAMADDLRVVVIKLAELLASRRAVRERYIDRTMKVLTSELEKAGIKAEMSGRPKHLWSIAQKMKRKNVSVDQVYDLLAIRVIVNDVPSCYAVLGVVHTLWPPIPGQFDDYIAVPKNNMYQSLHTAVMGPGGQPLETQVRTQEMHA